MTGRGRAAAALGVVLLAGGLVGGCQGSVPDSVRASAPRAVPQPRPAARLPTVRPSPRYLTRTYRAPARLVAPGQGGSLAIPSLHVTAPVDAVGLDGTAMALPDDPARVGWLRTTAEAGDRVGGSVLSGHVSDSHDVPGALNVLQEVRPGAAILWTDRGGVRHRFVVTRLHRYPRAIGVPARLFQVDGPHLLYVVTCADRETTPGGGFHYRSNLVVTARPG
ncbi:MAG: class F sortase [Marmoricola sp.]